MGPSCFGVLTLFSSSEKLFQQPSETKQPSLKLYKWTLQQALSHSTLTTALGSPSRKPPSLTTSQPYQQIANTMMIANTPTGSSQIANTPLRRSQIAFSSSGNSQIDVSLQIAFKNQIAFIPTGNSQIANIRLLLSSLPKPRQLLESYRKRSGNSGIPLSLPFLPPLPSGPLCRSGLGF